MVNYWKAKILPTLKKALGSGGAKKAAVAEATKTFDESKEGIDKEFDEKKTDLQPKVVEIYEAASVEIKTLVKKSTPSGLKKNSAGVSKFIEELVKIEFPGSKSVSEITTKFSPALASGPVTYIFEKVAILLPAEEPEKAEAAAAGAVEVASKEIAVEEGANKEEAAKKAAEEDTLAAAAAEVASGETAAAEDVVKEQAIKKAEDTLATAELASEELAAEENKEQASKKAEDTMAAASEELAAGESNMELEQATKKAAEDKA